MLLHDRCRDVLMVLLLDPVEQLSYSAASGCRESNEPLGVPAERANTPVFFSLFTVGLMVDDQLSGLLTNVRLI